MEKQIFILGIFILCGLSALVDCADNSTSSTVKELILTEKEKTALETFKAAVFDGIPERLKLLRNDLYFIRFLRSKRLNIEVAKKDLAAFLKHIDEQNIDSILGEKDWSDMETEFPFFYSSDKTGNPVGYTFINSNSWNVRKALLNGKIKRVVRWIYRVVLDFNYKLLDAAKTDPNANHFVLILDLGGFNLVQHGCPACLATFIQLLQIYEKWIPGYAKDIVIVNAPNTVYTILQTLKPVLSADTKAVIKIFGANKSVWKPFLDARIEPSKLPEFLGGTQPNPDF